MNSIKVIKTVCQSCHCECGVLVDVKDGRVIRIKGDPNHPMNRGFICPKAVAAKELVYHPERIKYPLRRVGERGEGKWSQISWAEALNTISNKLKDVEEKYGPLAITTSQGTGPRGYTDEILQFAFALGCNAMITAYMCFVPSVIAGLATYGAENTQEKGPDYLNSKCILVWGANPLVSHPPRGRDIVEAKKKGAKLIVVDPRRTELAAKADVWLQLRPATDDALALGMLNVIINEELYDRQFVNKWCVGFEKLAERVQEYPPSRVAKITWVPEEKIKEAARLYAMNKPAATHHRVAIEHHTNSIQNLRCLYILIGLTGNLDVKGGNLISKLPPVRNLRWDKEFEPPGKYIERLGADKFPLYAGPSALTWPASHNPTVIKAMLEGKPYPVKALVTFNNVAVNSENTKEVWEALNKLEFIAAVDFFMTPTVELADIVLPAATWLEKDSVAALPSYENYISSRQKAIEPVGECWDDKKIIFELAKRMGLDKWIPWKTIEEYNNWQLKPLGITFEDLKQKAYIIEPPKYKKYETEGFRTPSGKVELYSSIFEKHGYDPLPYYEENPETPESTPHLVKDYPLILISNRHIAYFHSEGRQLPSLRRLCPDPLLELNPETGKKLGISNGDWIWIETPRGQGRVKQKVRLTKDIHPQVCSAQHCWWFPEKPGPDHGCWESNICAVISNNPPYDPVCGSTPLRGLLCKVYKA